MSIHCIKLKGLCEDVPGFKVVVDAEKGITEPCSWINGASTSDEVQKRRSEHCFKSTVRQGCKRACGGCCGDNDKYLFKFMGELKSCDWIAEGGEFRKQRFCGEMKGACSKTCGACGENILPLQPSCADDPNFRLLINAQTGRTEPCSWIDDADVKEVQFRRQAQCFKPEIKAACKRACGQCCGDNPDHRIVQNNGNWIKEVPCLWLGYDEQDGERRKEKFCEKHKAACPDSCGVCSDVEGIDPECEDDPTFKILINAETGKTENCKWLLDSDDRDEVAFRTRVQCSYPDVQKKCPQTCGTCEKTVTEEPTSPPNLDSETCQDIPDFRLLINAQTGRTEPCSWIDDADVEQVEFRRQAQCFKPEIKAACKRACGQCCGDNPDHRIVQNKGNWIKEVSCKWLGYDEQDGEQRKEKFCEKHKAACPESCDYCPEIKKKPTQEFAGANNMSNASKVTGLIGHLFTFILSSAVMALLY